MFDYFQWRAIFVWPFPKVSKMLVWPFLCLTISNNPLELYPSIITHLRDQEILYLSSVLVSSMILRTPSAPSWYGQTPWTLQSLPIVGKVSLLLYELRCLKVSKSFGKLRSNSDQTQKIQKLWVWSESASCCRARARSCSKSGAWPWVCRESAVSSWTFLSQPWVQKCLIGGISDSQGIVIIFHYSLGISVNPWHYH